MSHVDFKKWPCRPVDIKGQGPHYYSPEVMVLFSVTQHQPESIGYGTG